VTTSGSRTPKVFKVDGKQGVGRAMLRNGLEATIADGLADSLDQKLYDAVKEQAGEAGLEYENGPAY
jgi:hypothetical protein